MIYRNIKKARKYWRYKKKTRDYEKELDRGMQPRGGTVGVRRRATGVSCRSTRGPG